MPQNVRLESALDFSGGLNLRADAFQLGNSESPDLLNVDLDPRGGFALRGVVSSLNSAALNAPAHSIFRYSTVAGVDQVLVGVGKNTLYSTGTNFTDCGVAWTVSTPQRATEFSEKLYIQNGTDAARSWNGSAISSALGTTFVDDFAAPTAGNMPKAKCIATHMGSVWVANTLESGTNYRNRVRWSHPNRPEDYRTLDYIDIDTGHDGDQIVGLAPWNDRLLVFKQNSVHVITGFDADTFQVFPLAQTTGAVSQESIAVSENGVYWFSWPDGVFFYDGRSVAWLWEKLVPAIQDSRIPAAYQGSITLGWLARRLWVSVPWETSTSNARVFVLDPSLSRKGGWTAYDLALGPMLEWDRAASATVHLACTAGESDRVLVVDQEGSTDTWLADHLAVGLDGGAASAPDSAALSITGDLDFRVLCALDSWTPSTAGTLGAKWETTLDQRSWRLAVDNTGALVYAWSANGAATVATKTSSATTGLVAGAKKWIRVVHDVNNGASGNDVKFYTGDDGINWTQLGTTQTTASTTTIFDSTARLTVGAQGDDSSTSPTVGKFYKAELRNGIAGTVVANPDFTAQEPTGGVCVSDEISVADPSYLLLAQGGQLLLAQGGSLLLAGSDPITVAFTDATGVSWSVNTPSALYSLHCDSIDSYYFTRWYDAGSPATVKKWRRPDIVMDNDIDTDVLVSVYRDYDPSTPARMFTLSTVATGNVVWGGTTWGHSVWSSGTMGAQSVERGSTLGRARTIQLKFAGPDPSVAWSVNAVNLKYINRRLR